MRTIDLSTANCTYPLAPIYVSEIKEGVTILRFIDAFCNASSVNIHELKVRTRKRLVVQPRQILMLLINSNFNYSLSRIGSLLGGYDHATVLHAKSVVRNLYETDKQYRLELDRIIDKMQYTLKVSIHLIPEKL